MKLKQNSEQKKICKAARKSAKSSRW